MTITPQNSNAHTVPTEKPPSQEIDTSVILELLEKDDFDEGEVSKWLKELSQDELQRFLDKTLHNKPKPLDNLLALMEKQSIEIPPGVNQQRLLRTLLMDGRTKRMKFMQKQGAILTPRADDSSNVPDGFGVVPPDIVQPLVHSMQQIYP